jgi:hypothetical protein
MSPFREKLSKRESLEAQFNLCIAVVCIVLCVVVDLFR